MKNEKCILLIWQEVPEKTYLYFIPIAELDCDFEDALEAAHSHYINETGWEKNKGLNFLCQAVYDSERKVFDFEPGFLESFKIDFEKPVECNVVKVYQSGFFL